jgi:hypothetical protein
VAPAAAVHFSVSDVAFRLVVLNVTGAVNAADRL